MRKFISLVGIGLIAAACSTAGATDRPGFTPASQYNVATGADQLLLRVTTGGGLLPPGAQLTHKPWFALYGDGRIVVQGPRTETSPAPLLPDLRQMQVTPAEIQKIVGEADRAGLLGPNARFDNLEIYDASTTEFTAVVDGKTHTISALALDYDVKVTDQAEAEARGRLSAFEREIMDLTAFLKRDVSNAETYEAAAMRVFAGPTYVSKEDELTRKTVEWPLTADPATAGEAAFVPKTRCLVLTGSELELFRTVALTTDTLTVWTYGPNRYAVYARPLYPDESGCPAS